MIPATMPIHEHAPNPRPERPTLAEFTSWKQRWLTEVSKAAIPVHTMVYKQPRIRNIGCSEDETTPRTFRVIGGGAYLYAHGLLEEFVKVRRGNPVTIALHQWCSYLALVFGMTDQKRQNEYFREIRQVAASMSGRYKTPVEVHIEPHGSAKRFIDAGYL